MSIFGYQASIQAPTQDNLGGYTVAPTDVYDCTIELAYFTRTKAGGQALNLLAKDKAGTEHKVTLYVTSMKDGVEVITNTNKEGKVSYKDAFIQADSICLLAAGKPMADIPQEDFVVKIRDWDAKKDVATQVKALKELHGTEIKLAMQRTIKNKQVKQGDAYVDTAEIRTTSELVKSFRASDNKTVIEVREQQPATFMDAWLEKYKGKDRDLSKSVAGNAGLPTAKAPALVF